MSSSRPVQGEFDVQRHRWTRQRQVVLEVLREASTHLDADEVYQLARKSDPRLSLSTVYRTLHFLHRRGSVRELRLGEGHKHYEMEPAEALDESGSAVGAAVADGCADPHHSHLICRACGAVVEFGSPLLDRLKRELEQAHGYAVDAPEIEVTGICGSCLPALASQRA